MVGCILVTSLSWKTKVEREDYVEFAKVQMNHYNFPAHAGSKKNQKRTIFIYSSDHP